MVSKPNAPEGLFEKIEKEPEESCLYKRLFLDYTYGLNKIYTQDKIAAEKASPSFAREYHLKYLGLIGNNFHTKDINGTDLVDGVTNVLHAEEYPKPDFNQMIQTTVKLLDNFEML
jgi:hypothetical protein